MTIAQQIISLVRVRESLNTRMRQPRCRGRDTVTAELASVKFKIADLLTKTGDAEACRKIVPFKP
ncbi:MAG: hypothetical protein ABIS50_15295 [Luteolibacter sp.]|uniref:hypothetical protein n=1 Tax=Luteolibacter sp. TaxID=1962973 RepID=UPI0032651727